MISRSLSPRHGTSSGCVWRNGLQYGQQLRIYWIKSRGHPTRGGPSALNFSELLTSPHRKTWPCYKRIHAPRDWTDPLVRPKPWKRGPLGRPKRRWEDNIKKDIQEVGWGMDVSDLAQDRDRWRALVIAVMNLRFHKITGNFLTGWNPVSFSRRTVPWSR